MNTAAVATQTQKKRPYPNCPVKSDNWLASAKLPLPPSECVCKTLVESLSCVADFTGPSTSSQWVKLGNHEKSQLLAELLSTGCDMLKRTNSFRPCAEIAPGDGSHGTYGPYAACPLSDKLSWAYNEYFERNSRKEESCDFGGVGRLVIPTNATTIEQCYDEEANKIRSRTSPKTSGATRNDDGWSIRVAIGSLGVVVGLAVHRDEGPVLVVMRVISGLFICVGWLIRSG